MGKTLKIENAIYLIRGHKVMLSQDLAGLYGVKPKVFIQAIKRNRERFPGDFMFQLTHEEFARLRSQIVTLEMGRGKYPKYPPYAFMEQGVAMLSSVLNSPKAIQVNIQIVRTFVRLRQMMSSSIDLARKIEDLEKRCDGQFHVVFEAIRRLMEPPIPKKRRIGFITENGRKEVSHVAR